MATENQASLILAAAKDVSRVLKANKSVVDQFLAHNSAISIDWAASPDEVDAALEGEDVSAAEVSNVIGSFAALVTYWASHGGNIEKFCNPVV